ncbi:hemolysin [Bacteroidia bacterium]|nr:hemolysin [Bacteroidia bacterium]GHT03265.1 hemolysin [Bacteroidia bacterium]GHT45555.1 hemolysin [Bacteroidia bacterium]
MNEEENIELRSEEFQEVLGGVPPWILRWGITILAIIVIILLIGSAILKYPDIISSRIVLTGSVPPAGIVARASGKLKELYVVDNQGVKSGDYLAVIDNPAHTQDILTLKEYMDRLDIDKDSLLFLPEKELRVGNLQSVYSSFYICLFDYLEYKRLLYYPQKIEMTRERIVQYEEQYRNLLHQQQLTNEQFTLTQKQFQRDSLLRSNGVISQEELEKSQSVYVQSKLSNENMRSSLNNMKIQIAQLKESLLDTGHQDIEALNGLRTQLQSLISQVKTEIQAWEISYVLKAPINGRITFTNYWIMNQNVSAGEDIFTIIPGNVFSVIGKASLPVARSGKVEIGQKVNIRIENFPENEYGILRGKVENISLVPTQSSELIYYTVEISFPDKLITTYKKELPYLPNMQGQADIITEDISLLERFVLPIKKILKERI